ncbi:MAG: type II secretion system protein GspG [Verrucomicrobiota bacterium]
MKQHSTKADGFTLVEILVVISIITVLAGLAVSAMSGAQNSAARNRARAEISALSLAIESYKTDNGDYPRDTNTTDALDATQATSGGALISNGAYMPSSVTLYSALSGDSSLLGTATAKVYFPFRPNMLYPKVPAGTARTAATKVQAIIDPFRNCYGYSTIGSGTAAVTGTVGYNPTFDLWSTAITDPNNLPTPAAWITNW